MQKYMKTRYRVSTRIIIITRYRFVYGWRWKINNIIIFLISGDFEIDISVSNWYIKTIRC